MNTYKGRRVGCKVSVTVDGFPLAPRLDLRDYSPNGFEWGYDGRGPAQLALAILADFLGDDNQALWFHRDFKRVALVHLNRDRWMLSDNEIQSLLAILKNQKPFPISTV